MSKELAVGLVEQNCSDIREDEDGKTKFYQHLIDHSQLQTARTFGAGSDVEIAGQSKICSGFNLNEDGLLDGDYMVYSSYIYAFAPVQPVPEEFNGQVVRIYSDGLHPGYAMLYNEDSGRELQRGDIAAKVLGFVHGPADTFSSKDLDASFVEEYPMISQEELNASRSNTLVTIDRVYAVHSPYWPAEAEEWLTRHRTNGVPSKSTMHEVIRYGCDLVQVPHKLSGNKNEWRFSFSKPELIIVSNWTSCQRTLYRTLHILYKIVQNRMIGGALSTYYFKTLMLWATENKEAEFWSDHFLDNTVRELLVQLAKWMDLKVCPNYFIPKNNMIDHISVMDLSINIDELYQVLNNGKLIADVVQTCRYVEVFDRSQVYSIEAPFWLYASLITFDQTDNSDSKSTLLFSRSFSELVKGAYIFNFSDLYEGLQLTRNLLRCINSNKKNRILNTVLHLNRSTDIAQKGHRSSSPLLRCSTTIARCLLHSLYMQIDDVGPELATVGGTKDATNGLKRLNHTNEISQKYLFYDRLKSDVGNSVSAWFTKNNIYNIDQNNQNDDLILLHTMSTDADDDDPNIGVEFYKELPGMSPTVNISWFLNKAYLANLYYTTQHDYIIAEKMCDAIINVYKLTCGNQQFSEHTLPVILSTDWTALYDKELQEMLGFCSLCTFLIGKADRSRSVCLGVCPVLFAFYLKFRCYADQLLLEKLMICGFEAMKHFEECKGDERIHNGEFVINKTLTICTDAFKRQPT